MFESIPYRFLAELHDQLSSLAPEFRLDGPEERDLLPETLDCWFGSQKWRRSGHAFTLLGSDCSGGMYCLWHYPELGNREPPVVFMGSEGEGVSVLADDLLTFIELLSTGKIWSMGEFEDNEFETKDEETFRRLAAERFGFRGRTANEIRNEALERHPRFSAWVEGNIE